MATILIVDDEPLTRQMLSTFLRMIGHQTGEAADSVEAWNRITDAPPDAVLLDIMLPEVNGLEFCRQLRQNPATNQLPVIMISAYAPPLTREASEAGADAYLSKPISLQTLKKTLASVGINP